MTGTTESSDFPTTVGAFDTSYNGRTDAFVVKLNASGTGLAYATFLGGSDLDYGNAIAVDGAGSAYVTGYTWWFSDFPTTAGAFDTSHNGYYDAFVVKLNTSGTGLAYATFLGGSLWDHGWAIAVDEAGVAYVTGSTRSSNFPATPGAFDTSYNGGYYDGYKSDAFVAKLNADGAELVYATFLGGSEWEYDEAIAVDGAGSAYVTGTTESSDFPTTVGAFDTSHNGYGDVFVAKLNASGTGLAYATFLGSSRWDYGNAIAMDGAGSAYVTGTTPSSDFPTTPGAFDTSLGGSDAFVVKLNANGTGLAYATFLGGSAVEIGYAIGVDGAGSAYVAGLTMSSDFPTTVEAFDRSFNGTRDAFVVKLNGDGTGLAYATFLGGSDDECEYDCDIAVDGMGTAYVTGWTESSDFPATAGAFDTSYNGDRDAFVAKLAVGGGPGPTPGENPPTTLAPPLSTPTDEMFDGTDPTEGYKYAAQGPIEIDIVIDRYYGPNNNGALDSSYIGKSVAEYSWLTIQAFDVDPDEVDRVFVNDHEVGRLTGFDGDWRLDSFPIPTDWLHFPDLSSGANPPDTTHAHNTIRIEIDKEGQGWATQVAWARFMVPGTRPVLLVHGLDIAREIFCYKYPPLCDLTSCDLTCVHNGWNSWQNWVNTDGSKGFLAEYGFPNVRSATENGTQGKKTRELESDVRAYTNGLSSYKDNSADIIAHILKVKYRYGVDKVNLVGIAREVLTFGLLGRDCRAWDSKTRWKTPSSWAHPMRDWGKHILLG